MGLWENFGALRELMLKCFVMKEMCFYLPQHRFLNEFKFQGTLFNVYQRLTSRLSNSIPGIQKNSI